MLPVESKSNVKYIVQQVQIARDTTRPHTHESGKDVLEKTAWKVNLRTTLGKGCFGIVKHKYFLKLWSKQSVSCVPWEKSSYALGPLLAKYLPNGTRTPRILYSNSADASLLPGPAQALSR